MLSPPFMPGPVRGEAFIGRQGLARNLRERILRGESLAVIGGPRLGKTSLVHRALDGLTEHPVIELDLGSQASALANVMPGSVVILDNLDRLADEQREPLLQAIATAGAASIVMTGGRRLNEWLARPGGVAGMKVRRFPLSVFLDGEARMLIGPQGHGELAEWTGNHPFLIQLLLHYRDTSEGPSADPANLVSTSRMQWEPFLNSLIAEVGKGPERALLSYLIERGGPVNPTIAQSKTGIGDIKAVADTLVYLGVISRWIRQEEATLFAGCRLLNEYLVQAR